ncbi:hypothetical protein [Paraburkholderia azotifigens]|uniref:Resolvase/invertase-type recombinase catalytic domain-containing protein n=1 Tax=Paraburkholderia azotifigens TaxID=2057004 RepID=A0A5C6V3L0_9BURK|nr:hypothetical protein [Paraburkholderia azotifigens]TXC79817.1 hypothetical protein FRZ40_36445 [Paraburkholderia azotifigens]
MNLLEIARESGMAVILDGRIGREEYQSVCGSLAALERFADALRIVTASENATRSDRDNGDTALAHPRRR